MQSHDRNVFPDPQLLVEERSSTYIVSMAWPPRWTPTPPRCRAVTNRRLFCPQVRKTHPPASIPSNFISRMRDLELDGHYALIITLTTGHQLYFFVGKEHRRKLMDDISAMQLPPPRFHFDHNIVSQDVQRLIEFFNAL
jgi:hypothetical protein